MKSALVLVTFISSLAMAQSAFAVCSVGNLKAMKAQQGESSVEGELKKSLIGAYTLEAGREYLWKIKGETEPFLIRVVPKAAKPGENRVFVKTPVGFSPIEKICAEGDAVQLYFAINHPFKGQTPVSIELDGASSKTYLGRDLFASNVIGALRVQDLSGNMIAAASSPTSVGATAPAMGLGGPKGRN